MRVRMTETVGSFQTGDVYDLQDDFAKKLVDDHKAKPTGEEKVGTPNKAMKREQVKKR